MCVFSWPGANVNRATANNDHTVVSLACAGGHLAVVELLLAHGADPTHRLKVNGFQSEKNICALLYSIFSKFTHCVTHVGWFNDVDRSC